MLESPSQLTFGELTRGEFDADFEDGGLPQTEYLWSYLGDLKAKSFIREPGYTDRHYLSDFTSYHARSFRVPEATCRRLHFFKLSGDRLRTLLDDLYGPRRKTAEQALNRSYLGFVVRRPLRRAHIGRTVLRTYPGRNARHYTVVRRYDVHLRGLHLQLDGLAFQQQDVGAAVCASTALWTALQRVARVAGHRTPTPSDVTKASGSPYSASFGLTESQMAHALANLGFAADTFVPGDDPDAFCAKVAVCLRSHLPVILACDGKHEAHAVTLTGYREATDAMNVCVYPNASAPLRLRNGSLRTVYVHDDNLGPHAHYEILSHPPEHLANASYDIDAEAQLWLQRGRLKKQVPWWTPDCLPIVGALVPKPSKVRMPVDDLLKVAWSLRHPVELVFDGLKPVYEAWFTTGVEYRRTVLDAKLDPPSLRHFNEGTPLPRHLAVVSAYEGDSHLMDLLLDATCVDLNPSEDSLLAVVAPGVPLETRARMRLESVFGDLGIALVSAPPPAA